MILYSRVALSLYSEKCISLTCINGLSRSFIQKREARGGEKTKKNMIGCETFMVSWTPNHHDAGVCVGGGGERKSGVIGCVYKAYSIASEYSPRRKNGSTEREGISVRNLESSGRQEGDELRISVINMSDCTGTTEAANNNNNNKVDLDSEEKDNDDLRGDKPGARSISDEAAEGGGQEEGLHDNNTQEPVDKNEETDRDRDHPGTSLSTGPLSAPPPKA